MRKLSSLLILTLLITAIQCIPAAYATGIHDDAVALNPDNPNVADSNNLSVQNWGSFPDTSFFAMKSGDATGSSYVTIQGPEGEDINNFKVVTYKHQDVNTEFAFYTSDELDGSYHQLPSTSPESVSAGQAGFGMREYVYTSLPLGTKFVKIMFPADGENWRLMIPSFDINTIENDTPGSPDFPDIPDAVIEIDGIELAESEYVNELVNVRFDNWGTGGVYGDGGYLTPISPSDNTETYVIINAPNDGYFSSFNIKGVTTSSGEFIISGAKDIESNYIVIPTEKSALSGANDGWNAQLYSTTNIPSGIKYIKVTFPGVDESWKLLMAGYGFEWTTEAGEDIPDPTEGYVEDDALAINPANANIADSNNVDAQSWGDFEDATFISMKSGDETGNTYITVKAPNETFLTDIKVLTYKFSDISEEFYFEAGSDLNGAYTKVTADVSSKASAHDNFDEYTYEIAKLPAGTKFVKVIYPKDGENWKLLVSSFAFNWSATPGEDNEPGEEPIPEQYEGFVEDDATEADESDKPSAKAVYASEGVVVSHRANEGFADESVYEPIQTTMDNPYIILYAENSAYIKNLTVNVMVKNTADRSVNFRFSATQSIVGEFSPVSASYRPFDTGSSNWQGKMYILSELPAGTKFVKIEWPENSSDYVIGSYRFEWSNSHKFLAFEGQCAELVSFVKNGSVGEAGISVLCEVSTLEGQSFSNKSCRVILSAYSGKKLAFVYSKDVILSNQKMQITFDNVGTSGIDRIKVMVIDNNNAVKLLAPPVEMY